MFLLPERDSPLFLPVLAPPDKWGEMDREETREANMRLYCEMSGISEIINDIYDSLLNWAGP